MRVIQERTTVPTVSYTRGSDLSGSLEGAGGIGGLLARSHGYASSNGNWYGHNCYHADGNGNVTYLVNSSQSLAASYRYDPYGNTISSSGTLASANVYRFSSKELHVNSGLYYYGYRWYHPNLQRWPNRDPLCDIVFFERMSRDKTPLERAGMYQEAIGNLYRFAHNDAVNTHDPYGLKGYWGCVAKVLWCEALSLGCPATLVGGILACLEVCKAAGPTACACCWLALPPAVGSVCKEAIDCWKEATEQKCLGVPPPPDIPPSWPPSY
jgi:RHS repeat-associated protein